jgi:hypothetical protein
MKKLLKTLRALEIDPQIPEIWYKKGNTLYKLNIVMPLNAMMQH